MTLYGEVIDVRRLTPSLTRIVLGGDGLDGYEPTEWTDQYVNALFIPDGAPYGVPFDVDEARQLAPEHRPVGRRYTIRRWDPDARTVTIDFVVHGDVGYAGRWAAHARPGDRLQMVGPSGAYAPDPDAEVYVFVGDESAIPAIGAALERIPAGRPALAVLVVDDEDHRLDLESAADLRITWVHRCDPDSDGLLHAVEALEIPEGRVDVFVHGEAGEVRAARRHLLNDRAIPRDGTSISPYWRRSHTDEQWREVKREWLQSWEQDVSAASSDQLRP